MHNIVSTKTYIAFEEDETHTFTQNSNHEQAIRNSLVSSSNKHKRKREKYLQPYKSYHHCPLRVDPIKRKFTQLSSIL